MASTEFGAFRFGGNHELRGVVFLSYPLEALLYDAMEGVPLSRRCILSYYGNTKERGDFVAPQVERFVASTVGAIGDGILSPDALINPKGIHSSSAPLSPAAVDLVEIYRKGGAVPLNPSRAEDGALSLAAKSWAFIARSSVRHQSDYVAMGIRPAGKVRPVPVSTFEKNYRRQLNREKRISRIQVLLDSFYSTPPGPEHAALMSAFQKETGEIYADLSALD